ncbi:MAG: tRNA (adenosine(37)-N6)-dimethylallyltransferase MiaA, partial [bacterium]|nr:tRNA (adenosine(37)-N6)-dimethylallyltransferase MiaA [bacterium]
KKNKNIIICGGTGFYINAFLYNYTFTDDTTNTAIKSHLLKESEKYGPVKMWERLNIIDPASARIIDPNNNKRVIRALEIYEHTKIPPSSFRKKSDAARKDTKIIGLTAPRELVYQRINNRVDQMIDTGLIDEVRQLLDMGYHQKLQAFEALGYKEAASYLTGSIEKQEMIELIKLKTRQFAKRQITWFKRFNNVHWINIT